MDVRSHDLELELIRCKNYKEPKTPLLRVPARNTPSGPIAEMVLGKAPLILSFSLRTGRSDSLRSVASATSGFVVDNLSRSPTASCLSRVALQAVYGFCCLPHSHLKSV